MSLNCRFGHLHLTQRHFHYPVIFIAHLILVLIQNYDYATFNICESYARLGPDLIDLKPSLCQGLQGLFRVLAKSWQN